MKVLKFGGTSVGSARRIKEVAALVTPRGNNIIVLSAMSGTTNTLVEIAEYLYRHNVNGAKATINSLEKKYTEVIAELYDKEATGRLPRLPSVMCSASCAPSLMKGSSPQCRKRRFWLRANLSPPP